MVWKWCRRRRLAFSAQPSPAISRPANDRMGHMPNAANAPAMENEIRQMLAKNNAADRGRSEQFGAIWIITTSFKTARGGDSIRRRRDRSIILRAARPATRGNRIALYLARMAGSILCGSRPPAGAPLTAMRRRGRHGLAWGSRYVF